MSKVNLILAADTLTYEYVKEMLDSVFELQDSLTLYCSNIKLLGDVHRYADEHDMEYTKKLFDKKVVLSKNLNKR